MAKILIVDDDVDLVNATKEVLESKGYKTIEANDGEAGFRKAKAEKPDLLLLDVMMKHDKEGFEIAREAQGRRSHEAHPCDPDHGHKESERTAI